MSNNGQRVPHHSVSDVFPNRWSPRSFTGEPIADDELSRLFEAARWAPSSYNSQPWRFLYAKRDSSDFDRFLGLLYERNQSWAKNASALVILVSKTTVRPPGSDVEVPSRTHAFDAGAAWAYLALEASLAGWSAHGIGGFDIERAASELKVPDDHEVQIAIAIGRRGERDALPEAFRPLEQPNARLPVSETTRAGSFLG
ncbi:nitroreductase family protein [Rhodopseudomonas palustris]|uniref:nitroreductase family protein n=1 Tax=Rhodopseudomonas palustris TaxID=1076 RepID=UPI000E5A5A04|nr:nitroreductase family protein [Rhodopseudomonas palustris]QLH70485.1 nitroreductase family protein [Rhodopseudomonas palustris]RIA03870.1 nitroreductase [Rhodopseudomonas palustris]